MKITEVKIKLISNEGVLQAFCCINFEDQFVVRDVKIIRGEKGLFVAMPSRKTAARCVSCASKNELAARYCQGCGIRLMSEHGRGDHRRLFSDIAHPINGEFRNRIEEAVLNAFEEERTLAAQPGYVSRYDSIDGCAA